MSTTTHPFTPEEVMAFIDGELSADRFQSVPAHIDQCAECGQLANQMRSASQSLSQWQITAPSASVQERIYSAVINSKAISLGSPNLGPRLRLLFSRPVWALAGLALLVVVGVQLFGSRPKYMTATKEKSVMETYQPSSPSLHTVAPLVLNGSDDAKQSLYDDKASSAYSFGSGAGKAPDRLESQPDASKTLAAGVPLTSPMIARAVALSIVVKDFDTGRASLDSILARHNGYAAGLNVATPQGAARTLQASLRIPTPQLAAAISELKALGRVEVETQNGEEVTQQHTDLVARLKNSRETEQRLQDVLRTRTGKVKDVLEVEQEIERVRGEIEQMEAEQQTLEHRVNFATIDLKLAEEYKAQLTTPAPSVAVQLRNAIVDGFRSALQSLLVLVLFLAESGPTLLVWLMTLAFPAWLIWRRYQRSLAVASSVI